MAPRRLYHLLLDYVLGFMVARQVSVQDVRGLPPDITHDLLHRLLSAASSVATKDQAEERAKRLDDQLLALLVSPHLTQLRLRLCVRVTDASFQHLFTPSQSPQGIPEFALQEVSLDSCWGVTDASLHRIAKHCPSLTKLELIGSPRFTAAAFDWSSLTSLQVLRVKACKGISDRAFDNLKDSPSTSLRVLSISGTENTDGNNFLVQLAQMCPNLEQLELVRPFSAPARVPVLQAGQFPHLRALSLGSDGGPTFARADERFVEALLDQLPHLVALRCSSIFDVGRLTNEDAARRLEVLITAARQGDMVPRIRPALQRSSSTLRVVCLPMVTGTTTTSYPSWGTSVPPPSQDEVYSLLQLLAQGLPGLRFLQFPSSDVEHLKKYLDYAQQREHQQELHTLQIMAMNGLHKLSAEGVEELIIRRMPLSVLDLRCYFGSPPVHGIYDKLRAKYPQLIGPRPLGAWAEFATLSDFGYHIC